MQQGLVLVVITIQFKECVYILVTELLTSQSQNVKFIVKEYFNSFPRR